MVIKKQKNNQLELWRWDYEWGHHLAAPEREKMP